MKLRCKPADYRVQSHGKKPMVISMGNAYPWAPSLPMGTDGSKPWNYGTFPMGWWGLPMGCSPMGRRVPMGRLLPMGKARLHLLVKCKDAK